MLKKCCWSALMLLLTIPAANAGLYFAPSALYQHIAARHVSFEGISPRWALGYDTVFSESFFAGIELFADWPFALLNNHRTQYVPYLRPKYTYGLSLLPGMVFDDYVIGYFRLGGLMTNFPQYDTRQKAFQVGVGMQYKLYSGLSLRGEYDYVQYQVMDPVRQPKANQASIGIVYDFDCWNQQWDS